MQLPSLFYSPFLLQHLSKPSWSGAAQGQQLPLEPSTRLCSLESLGAMQVPLHHSVGRVGEAPQPHACPAATCMHKMVFISTPGQRKFKIWPEQSPLLPPHPMAGAATHPQRWEALVVKAASGRENCAEISVLVLAGKPK